MKVSISNYGWKGESFAINEKLCLNSTFTVGKSEKKPYDHVPRKVYFENYSRNVHRVTVSQTTYREFLYSFETS